MADEKLTLEPEGDSFRLRQIEKTGRVSEVVLTEQSVLTLAQSSLLLRGRILAKHSREEVEAVVTTPVSRAGLKTDIHTSEVFLTLYDGQDTPMRFALSLDVVKPLSERLPVYVAEIEEAIRNKTVQ